MMGGKWDGPNLLSHYHTPVRREKGGGKGQRDKQREREKRGINQQGRWMRRCKGTVKREPKLRPNSDVYFI